VLLNPGDRVAVENPSYLAALQVFQGYEVDVHPIASDDDGMRMDALEAALAQGPVRMIYLTPTFQNPKGTTLALERRQRLVELAGRHQVPVVEDDPYGELRYAGSRLPTLASASAGNAEVIFLSTFSKTLAPGLRVGWAVASGPMIRAMAVAKQSTDLHTNTLTQRALAQLLRTFDLKAHVARLCAVYGERCRTMLGALQRSFPQGAQWTRPQGGLFLWCQLPDGVSTERLLAAAVAQKVAFVPGDPFFTGAPAHPYLRLNFSNRPPEAIEDGIGRLGRVLAQALAAAPVGQVESVHARARPARRL